MLVPISMSTIMVHAFIKGTESDQISALCVDPYSIRFINNPSEEVQITAIVYSGGLAIKHIENPSERVQLAAVKRDPHNFKHIKNPTVRTMIEFVSMDPKNFHKIKNPPKELIDFMEIVEVQTQ